MNDTKTTLTKPEIEGVKQGLEHYFPYEAGFTTTSVFVNDSWSDYGGYFHWKGRDDYFTTLSEVTGIQNPKQIKGATFILEDLSKKTSEKETVEKTTLSEEETKPLTEEAEKRKQQKAESVQRQKETVEEGIKKQLELYEKSQQQLKQNLEVIQKASEELKDKTIYAKVTIPEAPSLDKEEEQFLETLKTNSQNPKEFVTIEGEKLQERITQVFGDKLSKEEIKLLAESTAADIASKLNPPAGAEKIVPFSTQDAVLNALKNDSEVLPSVVKSEGILSTFKNVSISQLLLESDPERTRRIIAQLYLGKLTEHIYGSDLGKIRVALYTEKIEGAYTINLGKINSDAYQLQQRQSAALEHLSRLSLDQAQPILLSGARSYIQQKVESLPTQHAARIIYNSDIGRMLLARYSLADPFVYQATNAFGRIALQYAPDTAPYLATVGRLTGFNVGLGSISGGAIAIAASSYTATATSVTLTGGIMAGEAFLGGAGTAMGTGAAVGAAGGPLAWITIPAGAIAGALFGKVISKINEKLPAIKKWIEDNAAVLGIGFGLGAVFIGGPLRPIFTVLGVTFGGIALATGGLAAVGTGIAGIWGVLTGIGGLVAIEIATPVIVTLIAIPPLVAFIMFVINSGAYIVPPNPVSDSAFENGGTFPISCTDEKTSVSFGYNPNSSIAKRAWEITSDLYQGFWCFWNRSPGDLPTDKIAYKPSYPELFDMDKFRRNPNPTRNEVSSCGECLFWCTWLVQKSYKESGKSIVYTLWSPTMQSDFTSRGKFVPANQVTPSKALPGSVIFFDVNNSLARTDHVGIASSISADGVQFLQSNAGTKDGFIPFNSSGNGLQNIPGIKVLGIGLP